MRLDGGKSPDISCLGGKCKNRVPANIPKEDYHYQLCDSCWEKRQQKLKQEEEERAKKEKERIKREKFLRKNPNYITCGYCEVVFDKIKFFACPKCYPTSMKNKSIFSE